MITTLHCKFCKLYQGTKKDNTNYFILSVLEETEKKVNTYTFFINKEIASTLNNIKFLQNIDINFDIWFGSNDTMLYKIKQIVIEK